MLKTTLIVIVISLVAGATIRAWAFASFAFLVILALGVVLMAKGASFTGAIASCFQLLVVMEICYMASLFGFSLLRRIYKRRKKSSIADSVQVTGKPPRG
ncbi:hypothetical protein [Rhizobium herbae]|jgi:hypothetical protein